MKKQIEGQLNLFDYVSDTEIVKEEINSEDKISIRNEHKKKESNLISLYKECLNCWCSNCKHNEELDAVPRDFAGVSKPCPACSFCIKMKHAETCEINSYKHGCKLRAIEEGLYNENEIV